MTTEIIYSVCLYQRGMVIRGVRERELMFPLRPVGGKRQSVIKSPEAGDGNNSSFIRYVQIKYIIK